MLQWVKESDYHIIAGNFTIAKCLVQHKPRYTLWLGREILGVFGSADDAKKEAERRDLEEIAGAA